MANNPIATVTSISRKKKFDFSSLTIIFITIGLFTFLAFTSDTFLTYRNIYSIFGLSYSIIDDT